MVFLDSNVNNRKVLLSWWPCGRFYIGSRLWDLVTVRFLATPGCWSGYPESNHFRLHIFNSFTHIYRCYNMKADFLSKGLGCLVGLLFFKEFVSGILVNEGNLKMLWALQTSMLFWSFGCWVGQSCDIGIILLFCFYLMYGIQYSSIIFWWHYLSM